MSIIDRKNTNNRTLSLLSQELIWAYLCITFGFFGCANPVQPTGGPKDEIPPKIVQEGSSPNLQTNFRPQELVFVFDEYIKLNNPNQNVLISPPMEKKPAFNLKGERFVVDFEEADTLRPNTTYTFNFSNVVKDLNEGNVLEDFSYVFSTGDSLDKAQWKCKVVNTEGEAIENISVCLYTDHSDSAVLNIPYYYASTDEQGLASFEYLKPGIYKVVALKDDNRTLKYDLASKSIGYLDELVEVKPTLDSLQTITLFSPLPELIVSSRPSFSSNRVKVGFNRIDSFAAFYPTDSFYIKKEWQKDQLVYWVQKDYSDTVEFRFETKDTIKTYQVFIPEAKDSLQLRPSKTRISFLNKKAIWTSNLPLENIERQAFYLLDTNNKAYYLESQLINNFEVELTLLEDSLIALESKTIYTPTARLQGIFTILNHKDTLRVTYDKKTTEDFSKIFIDFVREDESIPYIIKILDNEDVALARYYFTKDSLLSVQTDWINPGQYKLEITKDENRNEIIDQGNYWENQQPEIPIKIKLPNAKANWEIKETINIEDAIKSRKSSQKIRKPDSSTGG